MLWLYDVDQEAFSLVVEQEEARASILVDVMN
jgi:hypothetical protein